MPVGHGFKGQAGISNRGAPRGPLFVIHQPGEFRAGSAEIGVETLRLSLRASCPCAFVRGEKESRLLTLCLNHLGQILEFGFAQLVTEAMDPAGDQEEPVRQNHPPQARPAEDHTSREIMGKKYRRVSKGETLRCRGRGARWL